MAKRKAVPRLLVISDRSLFGGDSERLVVALEQSLEGGAEGLQLGEGDLPGYELLALALRLREATGKRGALLLVADRVDVALAAGADGVHLEGGSLPAPAVRRLAGRRAAGFLIGRSARTVGEAALAQLEEVDYLLFVPVWPEPGLEALRAVVAAARKPVLAGGGVTLERVPALREVGVAGLALSAEVLGEADPREAAARYLASWESVGSGIPA